jgi:autotransporter translocation and assembly factor TamB
MRFLRNAILILVLLMAALLGAIGFILSSSETLRIAEGFLMKIAERRGNTLLIEQSKGSLSDLYADKITFESPSFKLEMKNFHFKFELLPLLWRNLNVKTLEASSLMIRLQHEMVSEDPSRATPSTPHQSWSDWIPKISIQNFHLPLLQATFPNGRTLKASLDIQKDHQVISLKHFGLSYPPLKLKLDKITEFKTTSQGLTWNNLCLKDNTNNTVCVDGIWKNSLNFTLSNRLSLEHLSLLDDIFPEMMSTLGKIHGVISVTVRKGTPSYEGELVLEDGSTYIPLTGMHPQKMNASLQSTGNTLHLSGKGISGEGSFVITGTLFDRTQEPRILSLSLDGENINVLNLSAGIVEASPHLIYSLSGLVQSVQGTVVVNKALINGDKIRSKASNNSDIVFISPSGKIEKQKSHLFSTNILVSLGDQSRFEGFGIKANLTGSLQIQSTPGGPILGSGEWTITDGHYETYGKKFSLKEGSLLFRRSPLSNPFLNVKALYDLPQALTPGVTNPTPIKLGVAVTGTVESPKFGFFSTPPMSQTDILSYIVLGAPLNQASINQQAQLSQAALSYALGNNNFSILEDLKESFGIDNLNVGTLNKIPAENLSPENNITGTNNTAVFVGKQINPRLYITYGLGLFNQEQELKTSYLLSSHWSFLTDTATSGNGADLVFTLDRDPSH